MSENDPREDYFRLSTWAAGCARRIAHLLGGNGPVQPEAKAYLDDGFVVTDPAAIAWAAQVFATLADRPGGNPALSEDSIEQRAELISAVAAHLRAMDEAIDLDWSPAWHKFLSPGVRRAIAAFSAFSADYRAEPQRVLALLKEDWRRAYDEERSSR